MDSTFEQHQCRRINGMYSKAGVICRSYFKSGDCTIEKTLVAINFNGETAIDDYGIIHHGQSSVALVDKFNLAIAYNISESLITTNIDHRIYSTGIYADSQKREPGRCISHSIIICEDGDYEFSFKTVEIDDVLEGEKVRFEKF